MSDERLRELERRWRESGDDADERAYLAERVRRGGLDGRALLLMEAVWEKTASREDLEVLAYAGDPLAYGVVGDRIIEVAVWKADNAAVHVTTGGADVEWDDMAEWAVGLAHWRERGAILGLSALLEHRANSLHSQVAAVDGERDEEWAYEEAYAEEAREVAVRAVRACLCEIFGGERVDEELLEVGYGYGYRDVVDAAAGVLQLARDRVWRGALLFPARVTQLYSEIGPGDGDPRACAQALPGILRRRILGDELAARLEAAS